MTMKRRKKITITPRGGRCPACNMGILTVDETGSYCANCLYTPAPKITIEDAVAREEAIAIADARSLREGNNPPTRKRAA